MVPWAWPPKTLSFCSRGTGLFIGVDLIKDEATRTPATDEANYVVSRYFFFRRVTFAASKALTKSLPLTSVVTVFPGRVGTWA